MSQMLPLFPLGTVLYPGVLLPLHIFEERYRQLVRDLLSGPELREFGVIAIRKGRETGVDGVSALYEVGCTATVRRVKEHEDGRFELVTAGTRRFRLEASTTHARTCRARWTCWPRTRRPGGGRGRRAGGAAGVPRVSRRARHSGTGEASFPELPDEPVALSYLVAASMVADLADRQSLLAEPDALSRLAPNAPCSPGRPR